MVWGRIQNCPFWGLTYRGRSVIRVIHSDDWGQITGTGEVNSIQGSFEFVCFVIADLCNIHMGPINEFMSLLLLWPILMLVSPKLKISLKQYKRDKESDFFLFLCVCVCVCVCWESNPGLCACWASILYHWTTPLVLIPFILYYFGHTGV
jgi:hypothetical protein